MKRFMISVWVAGLLATAAPAQDPAAKPATGAPQTEKPAASSGEAMDILKKADEATKKLKSVRYVAEWSGSGSQAKAPRVSGTVVLGGEKVQEGLTKFRFEVKVEDSTTKEVTEYVAASNGDKYWLVDHKKKTVAEDIDDIVLGDFRRLMLGIGMREFVHPQPFSDELNGKSELQGGEKIGNEDCHKIHVVYANNQGEATWWFSKKDFLPRAVERIIKPVLGSPGTTLTKITELTAEPAFTIDPFVVIVPEGYKKEGGPEPVKPAAEEPKKPEGAPEPKKP